MEFIGQFALLAVIFIVIDAVWLMFIAKKFYQQEIGGLLLAKPNLTPAAVFYGLYVFGMMMFALRPALANDSLGQAVAAGALLGLLMYATYDLTNQSTLKGWSKKVTLADLAWGTFVTSATVALSFVILSAL